MARIGTGDGFKFWASYYDALKVLPSDEARGRFVRLLCAYVFDGVEPKFSSDMERFGFTLVADQAAESKRLYDVARAKGAKSGESRRKKSKKQEFSTSKTNTVPNRVPNTVPNTVPNRVPNTVPNVSRYVSSSFQEEEKGAAGAGPWGPAPPRLEDLPPIPGQRDTNGGDCE